MAPVVKKRRFLCKTCRKNFTAKWDLDSVPYNCDKCNHTTKCTSDLKRHKIQKRNVKAKEKVEVKKLKGFRCQFCKWDKTSSYTSCVQHVETHHPLQFMRKKRNGPLQQKLCKKNPKSSLTQSADKYRYISVETPTTGKRTITVWSYKAEQERERSRIASEYDEWMEITIKAIKGKDTECLKINTKKRFTIQILKSNETLFNINGVRGGIGELIKFYQNQNSGLPATIIYAYLHKLITMENEKRSKSPFEFRPIYFLKDSSEIEPESVVIPRGNLQQTKVIALMNMSWHFFIAVFDLTTRQVVIYDPNRGHINDNDLDTFVKQALNIIITRGEFSNPAEVSDLRKWELYCVRTCVQQPDHCSCGYYSIFYVKCILGARFANRLGEDTHESLVENLKSEIVYEILREENSKSYGEKLLRAIME